jgi:site-specific DNA recombinase
LIRRIFELFASGTSLKNIAGTLNAERIPPLRLRKGKTIASWCPSAIRAMLRNEVYIGRLVWNRTQSVKQPGTNNRTFRARPRNEWVIFQQPELRIVSSDLWQRTLDRRQTVRERFCQPGAGQNRTDGHLLSGFLRCGECGGNMIIVGRKKYGCREHWIRKAQCTNNRLIEQSNIESQLFAELQKQILTTKAIDYVLAEVDRQVRETKRGASAELATLERRLAVIEKELGNLARVIAATGGSPAVIAEIVVRDREREDIVYKLASLGKDAFEDHLAELKAFMLSSLSAIQQLLTDDPARAKAKLAKHTEPIRLTPAKNGYTVEGEWNLLGASRAVVAGGRNERCIPFRFLANVARSGACTRTV